MIDSRHKDDIIAHFTARGAAFCAQITDVACDIWDAYIAVAKTCFPKAKLILDRFHVTKLLNNCLDTFRKTLRTTYLGNDNFKN